MHKKFSQLSKQIKLSIAPINWSNDDFPSLGGDIPLTQCLSEMQRAGFSGTELGSKYPQTSTELLPMLSDYKLQLSSAWFSTNFIDIENYKTTLERFMQFLSFMRASGADVINICETSHCIQQKNTPILSGQHKPILDSAQQDLLIQGLHEIGRLAYDYGMQLSYHYHIGTVIENSAEISWLMDHTCPDLMGLLLDTGHAYAAGIDPMKLLDDFGDRINQVHLKDIRQTVLNTVKTQSYSFEQAVCAGLFTVPGDGCIDFESIFSRLNDLHYQGWCVVEAEQDPQQAEPLHYATKARSFIYELTGV